MSTTAESITPSTYSAAIENNLFALIETNRCWPQAQVQSDDEVLWTITPFPHVLYNAATRTRVAPERADPLIESVVAQARQRNVPLLWWTGPQTRPVDFSEHLLAFDFKYAGVAIGMATDIAHMPTTTSPTPGLEIRRVRGAAALRDWCRLTVAVFEPEASDTISEPFADFLGHVDPDMFTTYLGLLDGQPVATSMLILAAGTAGIYNVATLPSARNRGIGTAMTLRPLQDARALGYRISVLQASEMGASIYRRIGFREYCRLGQYVWTPA